MQGCESEQTSARFRSGTRLLFCAVGNSSFNKTMKYLLLINLILIFCACKDENSKKYTQVKVNVNNYTSGLPIEDITCAVYEQDAIGKNTLLKSSNTTGGIFEYSFLAKKNKSYFMTCSIDLMKYYSVSFAQYLPIEKYTLNSFEFFLTEYTYITFDITNTNCFDSQDNFYFVRTSETGYNGYTPVTLIGCQDILPGTYGKIPEGKWYFQWQVTKNSITTSYNDTISLLANDSIVYVLNY